MIFVSHDIPQVIQVCDRMLVLDRGKTAHLGDCEEGARRYFELAAGRANYAGTPSHEMARVRVSFGDGTSRGVHEIEFGTPLDLRVDYEFPSDAGALEIVLRILSPEGVAVAAPSSGRDELFTSGLRGMFRCQCEGLKLLPGSYRITAHLREPNSGRILDHFLHQSPLVVKAPINVASLPPAGFAAVDVDQRWTRLG
jgi:hypothetical protein